MNDLKQISPNELGHEPGIPFTEPPLTGVITIEGKGKEGQGAELYYVYEIEKIMSITY